MGGWPGISADRIQTQEGTTMLNQQEIAEWLREERELAKAERDAR